MRTSATQSIRAPLGRVFEVFTDVENCAGRITGVKKAEVLSEVRAGKGLKWRETRELFGKDAAADKEITAIDAPRSFRVESRVDNTLYVSTYEFAEAGDGTVVTWLHDSVPLTFGAKLATPMLFLMKGVMRKYMQKDLVDLAGFLERAG